MIYTLDEIKTRVIPVAVRYGLKAVYIFGSYARGEAIESSDIDLLVDTEGTELKSLMTLGALYCDLEKALSKNIDLITANSLEQRAQLPSDSDFKNMVEQERVNLYAIA